MVFRCSLYGLVLVATILISDINCRTTEPLDSFDESFEDSTIISSELEESLKPAEDVILGFINRLVKTGYLSSKITLNRIEKANEKRRELGNQIQSILMTLPNYSSKVPLLDDLPRVFENPHEKQREIP